MKSTLKQRQEKAWIRARMEAERKAQRLQFAKAEKLVPPEK